MQIFRPDKQKIIEKFKKSVVKKRKKFNSNIEFFSFLKQNNISRIKLMLIDSCLKGLNLENHDKTLLLFQNDYVKLLIETTNELKVLKKSKNEHLELA